MNTIRNTLCLLIASSAGLSNANNVVYQYIFVPNTPARAAEVNANFSAVKAASDDNYSLITLIQQTQAAHASRLTNLETNSTSLATRLTTTEGNYSGLSTRVGTAETSLTSVTGRVTTAESTLNSLSGRVTTAESNMTALTTRTTTAEANIVALQNRLNNCTGNSANDIMVRVGPICVDKYQGSVWSNPDGTGTQYGAGVDNYPSTFPDNGNYTTPLYAASKAGVRPSANLTWFQAMAACALAGKRLLTNQEWQMAAMGTPDASCPKFQPSAPWATDHDPLCSSAWGVVEKIWTRWEWTADWVQGGSPSWAAATTSKTHTPDYLSHSAYGVNQAPSPLDSAWPSAVARGGEGQFSISLINSPSDTAEVIGFRCAR